MAITIRSVKGSALTHSELDTNFRSFYYSSSVTPSELILFTTASGDTGTVLSFNNAAGNNYQVQFKSGSADSGSLCRFSSSANFLFDYDQNHLKVTGSGYITGDLTVGGSVQAQTFHTEFVTSSIIYESGSNKFGDSTDDTHEFTGSLHILGPVTQSGNFIQVGNFESTGSITHSGSINNSGSITNQGNVINTGNLTNTGDLTNIGYLDITGSITSSGLLEVNGTGTSTFSSHLRAHCLGIGTTPSTTSGTIVAATHVSSSNFLNNGAVSGTHLTGSFTGSFTGDGSNLTGLPVQTYTNATDNRVLTSTGTDSINGETNLTFDGTDVVVAGGGKVAFRDNGGEYVYSVADGTLGLAAGSEIDLTATTIDINGAIDASSTITAVGDIKTAGNITGSILFGKGTTESSNTGYKTVMINTTDGRLYYTGSYGGGGGGGGGATVHFPAPHRVVTAGFASSSLSASVDLTWNGTTLAMDNTLLGDYTASAHSDIISLIGGNGGTLLEGRSQGDVVIGIRDDATTDKFAVVSGRGDYYSGTTYDFVPFSVDASGSMVVGGTGFISGSLNVVGDVTAFYSSDERLKDNLNPIHAALDKLKKIGGYEFDWNDKSEHEGHDIGVIAQEIEKVLPELVVDRDTGYKAVRYEKIVALLIEAIKDQQKMIDENKARIDELFYKLNQLL